MTARACRFAKFLTSTAVWAAMFFTLLLAAPALSAAEAAAVQANNEEYTAKIRQYTTSEFFSTELVDHLPASDKVPAPDKVLGYIVGTPDKLSYSEDANRYMRALAEASPRVKMFSIGKTDEGREMIAVVISDESTIARLDQVKQINARLADPRTIKEDAEARRLMAETKPVYWLTGALHPPETGSLEMLMELAYRLAVEETPFIQNIRKNEIVMITPCLEPDGRDKEVDVYRYRKENPGKTPIPLLYWNKYVMHDNNRDGITLSLRATQNYVKNFLEWHPAVHHDLHESVAFLWTASQNMNAWQDPMASSENSQISYYEVEELTKRGVPGVWTPPYFAAWAPNSFTSLALNHNAIGRLYETFGMRGADTGVVKISADESSRQFYRPNPPFKSVYWSIRNNVNVQQSGVLLALSYVATNRDKVLNDFYLKSKRAVAKATTEGPAAYVLPAGDKRPFNAADLVNLLRRQGCEVQIASEAITTKQGTFPAGSYIVRMDQPYSRLADMLLDVGYYNAQDQPSYDDTGWTLGALKNVKTVRVTDPSILQAKMTLLTADVHPRGELVGSVASAYAIPNTADNNLATLRFRLPEVKMLAAESGFEANGVQFGPGTCIVAAEGDTIKDKLAKAARDLGFTAYALDRMPSVPTHPLAVPRIALLHTWASNALEGWSRLALDTLGIPFTYISDHDINPNLRSKFDVILFAPVNGSAQRIVNGTPLGGEPIPWKATKEYPNLIGPNGAQTDNIRGGMGVQGVADLQRFVEQGGLLVMMGSNSAIPIDYGLVEGLSLTRPDRLQAKGSVLNAEIADKTSPVTYGYDDNVGMYFGGPPVLELGSGTRRRGYQAGPTPPGRESGRGGLTDPDVVQGRPPYVLPKDAEAGEGTAADMRGVTSAEIGPRVLLRWAPEKDLLISGMLAGGSELAGKPAVVDASLGKGHILFFATNPFWRMETSGDYMLVLNAAMNFDHLSSERPISAREGP